MPPLHVGIYTSFSREEDEPALAVHHVRSAYMGLFPITESSAVINERRSAVCRLTRYDECSEADKKLLRDAFLRFQMDYLVAYIKAQ